MQEGQLSLDYNSHDGTLRVTLPNFPTPDEKTDGLTPDALYRDPETGELQGEPPIHRDTQKEGRVLLRRDDNDEVCGFEVEGFNYGDNISLINYEGMENPYLVVNPPEI